MRRNTYLSLFAFINILSTNCWSGDVFMDPSKSVLYFKRDSGDTISLNVEASEFNRLDDVRIQIEKTSYFVPKKHLLDIDNPELYSIKYRESRETGKLVYQIEIDFDRRIYSWGSSSSRVVYLFKDHIYHGREILVPVSITGTKSEFQNAPMPHNEEGTDKQSPSE